MSEDQKTRLAPVVVTRIKVNTDIVTPASSAAAADTIAAIEAHETKVSAIVDALKDAGIEVEIDPPAVTRRHVPISDATPAKWPEAGAGGDGSEG